MVKIIQNLVSSAKYNIKCPYSMTPTRIVVHNTANDASARNEIQYMITNNNKVSFHFAVDDSEVVQGIPLDRNAWHSGDGNGKGNREGIAIEICYSKSGGDKFIKAEQNAASFIAELLKERGWSIDKVTKHQDYSNKYCPHRTLDMGWQRFLDMVQKAMNGESTSSSISSKKSNETIADEVIAGKWGNGSERKTRLTNAGYDYSAIQAIVNQKLGGSSTSSKKSNETIADEVIAGKWGNGSERKTRLTNAGYDYSAIQAIVNQKLGGSSTSSKKSNETIADEVIAGKWGNGSERKTRLTNAGYDYSAIQAIVNQKLK